MPYVLTNPLRYYAAPSTLSISIPPEVTAGETETAARSAENQYQIGLAAYEVELKRFRFQSGHLGHALQGIIQ